MVLIGSHHFLILSTGSSVNKQRQHAYTTDQASRSLRSHANPLVLFSIPNAATVTFIAASQTALAAEVSLGSN
jgi:hypothetical protein